MNTYHPKRTYHIFDPESKEPFDLSRSKLELFVSCSRCFYLDLRLGVAQPPGFPFNLNRAVDELLKKEFDIHRAGKTTHPLMKAYGLEAVPFSHEKMSDWRNNRIGIRYLHEPTNLILYGAIDDIWHNTKGELAIVDYKATSKKDEVTLDADWQMSYKRQMEIYQWLFKQNGFKVSDTGYFVYCNGKSDKEAFDGKLEFDVQIIPYNGNGGWIEKALLDARACLERESIPAAHVGCDFCAYREATKELEK